MSILSPWQENTRFEIYSSCLWFLIASPFIKFASLLKSIVRLFHPLLFIGGWLLRTWLEYLVHRFLMYPKNDGRKTGTSQSHQHHHRQPSELEVTFFYRIVLFIFNCGIIAIAWRLNDYFTFFAAFSWGSAAFCYIHYLLHCQWTRRLMPRHHRIHIYHHCKYTNKCFGVTVTWWDRLFGTVPERNREIPGRIIAFYYQRRKKHPPYIPEKRVGPGSVIMHYDPESNDGLAVKHFSI